MSDGNELRPVFVTRVCVGEKVLFCTFDEGVKVTIPKSLVEYVYKDETLLPDGVDDEYLDGETDVVIWVPLWLVVDRGIEDYLVDEAS